MTYYTAYDIYYSVKDIIWNIILYRTIAILVLFKVRFVKREEWANGISVECGHA